ncbi:hypothetical protein GY45DRAFT_1368792 [Cubamyces sp. BRFM 1775]|nr:hypothetical protein GY45DRAFT_1368792 [Cubamyces sp. BRFM 1775]
MFRSLVSRLQSTVPPTADEATKDALLAVVQVWLDRLQTMAVITTFFVSIDSMLYGYATVALPQDLSLWSSVDVLKSATLGGAIILHVCASILAYLASFVLIRYRLEDAEDQVQSAEHPDESGRDTPLRQIPSQRPSMSNKPVVSERVGPAATITPRDFRSLVTVYQVKPFAMVSGGSCTAKLSPETPSTGDSDALHTLRSMIQTLTRCHTVVGVQSTIGFILALVGTIAYFWTALPVALGSFASVCLGVSLVAGAYAIM